MHVGLPGPLREPGRDALALFDRLTLDRSVTVAACAPLTNVARFARRQGVEQIVLVGGELVVEDEPEFNVGHDPSAAAAVLDAGVPTTVYPVDLFESVVVPPLLVAWLEASTVASARLAGELLRVRRGHMLGDAGDAGALVFLAHPELFEVTSSRMAVVDRRLFPMRHSHQGSPVQVVRSANATAVVEAFIDAVQNPC